MPAECGTPEGFRLHKRREQEPCPACKAAMGDLLARVRAYRAAIQHHPVIGALAQARALNFSAHQRTLRPAIRAAERAAEQAEHPPTPAPPAPAMVAMPCVGDEHWMPGAPKTWLKKFRAAGWQVRLTRAGGPYIDAKGAVAPGKELVFTLALAAKKDDRRVVMTWKYDGTKWPLDDVFYNKQGVIKSTDLKEIING